MGLFSSHKKIDTSDQDDFPLAKKTEVNVKDAAKDEWLEDNYEGQLAVDVYQDKNNLVIKSTIAGVKPQDLDISITNDMVTIRGKREQETKISDDNFFFQECYWGSFSRSIILPAEVKPDKATAALKNGVLTIVLPKATGQKAVTLQIKGD